MLFNNFLFEAGECTFRYDDTNPEAESQEFIDNLAENVKWLGWKPGNSLRLSLSHSYTHAYPSYLSLMTCILKIVKTTFSSDYFDELYELARYFFSFNHYILFL